MSPHKRYYLSVLLPFLLAPYGTVQGMPISPDITPESLSRGGVAISTEGRSGSALFPDLKQALRDGRYEYLQAQAREVLKDNPRSVLAYEVLGTTYLYQGNPGKAAEAFREGVSLNGNVTELWTKLGIALMEAEELEGAEQALNRAVTLDSTNRVAHQRLGLLNEYLGNSDKAIFHLNQGLEGTPKGYLGVAVNLGRLLNERNAYLETIRILEPRVKNAESVVPEAWLVLATAQLQSNNPESAEANYRNFLRGNPGSREGLLGLAMAQRQAGKIEAALESAATLVEAEPNWLPAVQEMAEIHLQQGNLMRAQPYLDRSEELGTKPAVIQKRIARFHRDQEQPVKAISILEKLVSDGSADPSVYTFLSELQIAEGNVDSAVSTLQNAVETYPESGYLHFRLANLFAAAGEYNKAAARFKEAGRLDGDDPRVLKGLLVSQARSGHTDDAVDTASRLLALSPDDAGVNFLYASRLELAGQTDEAIDAYEKLLAIDPEHAPGLNNLATLKIVSGDYGKSLELATKAVEAGGANAKYLDTLGWVHHLRGETADALYNLRKAAKLEPDNATIRYHLGAVLIASGHRSDGREELKRAIALGGNSQWVEDAKQLLN